VKIISLYIHNQSSYFVGSERVTRIEQVQEAGQMAYVAAYDIYIQLNEQEEKLWKHIVSSEVTIEYE
jgi:hypothetical protein